MTRGKVLDELEVADVVGGEFDDAVDVDILFGVHGDGTSFLVDVDGGVFEYACLVADRGVLETVDIGPFGLGVALVFLDEGVVLGEEVFAVLEGRVAEENYPGVRGEAVGE